MEKYFDGTTLFGDDFNSKQIIDWFKEEEEAYYELTLSSNDAYQYKYHALNNICGFKNIVLENRLLSICAFGSAYGDELRYFNNASNIITLIDSANSFNSQNNFIKANPLGNINCESNKFDIITCLGVLHHIPNVSFVFKEIVRILKPGGVLLVREPITSMGDWRFKRQGVTKNERGLPDYIFNKLIVDNELTIISKKYCVFPPLNRLCSKLGIDVFNNSILTYIDILLCAFFKKNISYHRVNFFKKIAPASCYYVCKKDSRA